MLEDTFTFFKIQQTAVERESHLRLVGRNPDSRPRGDDECEQCLVQP